MFGAGARPTAAPPDCPSFPCSPLAHVQLTDSVPFAGALGDPVAALLLCTPGPVELVMVNGEVVVSGGTLLTCDVKVRRRLRRLLACCSRRSSPTVAWPV